MLSVFVEVLSLLSPDLCVTYMMYIWLYMCSVYVCLLEIYTELCCWLDPGIWSLSSPGLISWICQVLTDLSLTHKQLQIWSPDYVRDGYAQGLCSSPMGSDLLIRDCIYQLPMFLGFIIHIGPIFYLFQGRFFRNKSWEHFHINNSHVGDVAVSCVTKMREVLLVWSANGKETSEWHF